MDTGSKFHFFPWVISSGIKEDCSQSDVTLVVILKEVWVLLNYVSPPSDLCRIAAARTDLFVWGSVVSPGVKTAGLLRGLEL